MIIHREFQQQSLQWLNCRAGIPTASEFGCLVTPKFAIRTGEMVESYLALKLAERWIGSPLYDIGSWATEQGSILEERAIPWLELELGKDIERVGFITDDQGRWGASPDGVIEAEGIGVEIKSFQPPNAIKCLLRGQVPDDHLVQVQGSLFVTGFNLWKFVSYSHKVPKLVIDVEPDAKAQLAIEESLLLFCDRLERGYKRLVELNGGEPSRSVPATKPEYEPNMEDVPS